MTNRNSDESGQKKKPENRNTIAAVSVYELNRYRYYCNLTRGKEPKQINEKSSYI